MNLQATGWNALVAAQPIDPLQVIASCQLSGAIGVYTRSTTFLQGALGTNTLKFSGNSSVVALDTTDASQQILATQWALKTKMTTSLSNSPVGKIAFVKAGALYDNVLEITLGATNWTDVQLSFRDNLATTGYYFGSATPAVPVFSFAGTHTSAENLHLTIPNPGTYSLVLVLSNSGSYSAFEMEIIAV
jgi:hypothetical protein